MKKMEYVNHVKGILFLDKVWIHAWIVLQIVNGKEVMEKLDKDVFVSIDINGVVNKHNALSRHQMEYIWVKYSNR